jgi:hypothetical protein
MAWEIYDDVNSKADKVMGEINKINPWQCDSNVLSFNIVKEY